MIILSRHFNSIRVYDTEISPTIMGAMKKVWNVPIIFLNSYVPNSEISESAEEVYEEDELNSQ